MHKIDNYIKFIIFLILIPILIACTSEERQSRNCVAFTKTYGYIRYFYPTKESQQIDWDRFVYYGLDKVKDCSSKQDLCNTLLKIFKPICPDISISIGNQSLNQKSTDKLSDSVYFWQYYGLQSSDKNELPFRNKIVCLFNNHLVDSCLFDLKPESAQMFETRIGGNIMLRFPILISKQNFEEADKQKELGDLINKIKNYDKSNVPAQNKMLAEVIVFWNVIQHFYPYHEESKLQWNDELISIIKEIIKYDPDKYSDEFLLKMGVLIKDGHFLIPTKIYPQYFLPIICNRIKNMVIVSRSFDTIDFKTGDIIQSIDAIEANRLIDSCKKMFSGSDQIRECFSCSNFHWALKEDSAIVTLIRNRNPIRIKVKRINSITFTENNSYEVNKNIYYINLDNEENIDRILDISSKYKGIILDLRGGNGNFIPFHKLLQHLTSDTLFSPFKFLIPKIIYPDRIGMSYDEPFQFLEPVSPKYKCKLVVLTSAWDISYSESQIKFVQLYKLGTIIGEQTGGTNGVVNYTKLPTGTIVRWTGGKCMNLDGSQHHLIGIRPDIEIKPDISNLLGGKDTILEYAIDYLKSNI